MSLKLSGSAIYLFNYQSNLETLNTDDYLNVQFKTQKQSRKLKKTKHL